MNDSPHGHRPGPGLRGVGRSGPVSLVKSSSVGRPTGKYTVTSARAVGKFGPLRGSKHRSSTSVSLRLDANETHDLQFLMNATGLNQSNAIRLALHEAAEAKLTERLREQSALSGDDPAEKLDRAELETLLPSVGLYDDDPDTTADKQSNTDQATE